MDVNRFKQLAERLGEPLDAIYSMQDAERRQLMEVMGIGVGVDGDQETKNDEYDVNNINLQDNRPLRLRMPGKKRGFFAALDRGDSEDDDFVPEKKLKPSGGFDFDAMKADFISGFNKNTGNFKPSTSGASSSGRPSRRAAKKASNLTTHQINDALDTSDDAEYLPSQEDLDAVTEMELPNFGTQSRKDEEAVFGPDLQTKDPNDVDLDEKLAQRIEIVNKSMKDSLLIDHVRNPKEFMKDLELPVLKIEKLKKKSKIFEPETVDERISKHTSLVQSISSKGLVHAERSPISWQKVLSSKTRKKFLNVKFSKTGEEEVADNFELEKEEEKIVMDEGDEKVESSQPVADDLSSRYLDIKENIVPKENEDLEKLNGEDEDKMKEDCGGSTPNRKEERMKGDCGGSTPNRKEEEIKWKEKPLTIRRRTLPEVKLKPTCESASDSALESRKKLLGTLSNCLKAGGLVSSKDTYSLKDSKEYPKVVDDGESDDDEVKIVKEVESPLNRKFKNQKEKEGNESPPTAPASPLYRPFFPQRKKEEEKECPICLEKFPLSFIETHAATCQGM